MRDSDLGALIQSLKLENILVWVREAGKGSARTGIQGSFPVDQAFYFPCYMSHLRLWPSQLTVSAWKPGGMNEAKLELLTFSLGLISHFCNCGEGKNQTLFHLSKL